eukprot:jgi/Mesvir1/1033/Mv17559-RA.2
MDERKLAHDARALFTDVHKELERLSDPKDRSEAVRQYSQNISYAMGRVDESDIIPAGTAADEDPVTAVSRAVWELLEVFYVHPHGSLLPALPLSAWLRRNSTSGALYPFATSLPNCYAQVSLGPEPEQTPAFWSCLRAFVALGSLHHAVALLKTASCLVRREGLSRASLVPEDRRVLDAQCELFEALVVLLENFPGIHSPKDAAARSAFRSRWLNQFQALLNTVEQRFWRYVDGDGRQDIRLYEEVGQLARVVAGDGDALAHVASDWMELLVATLLHVHPDAKPDHAISHLLRECMRRKPPPSSRTPPNTSNTPTDTFWEELFQAVVTSDTQEVVRLCSDNLSSWSMAHITDLLAMASPSAASVVASPLPGRWGVSQAEYYLLEYAISMCGLTSTWHIGAAYLQHCPTFGREELDMVLGRLPVCGDDRLAQKLLRFCDTGAKEDPGPGGQRMRARASAICRVVAAHKWAAGQLAGAATWWQQGRDSARLATLGSLLLPHVTAAGTAKAMGSSSAAMGGVGADASDTGLGLGGAAGKDGAAREGMVGQLEAVHTVLSLLTPDTALLAFVTRFCAFRRDMDAIARFHTKGGAGNATGTFEPTNQSGIGARSGIGANSSSTGQGGGSAGLPAASSAAAVARGAMFEGKSVQARYGDAGLAVEEMLVGRLAPRRLWMEILAHAVPLLEGPYLVFGTQATSAMISLVEELAMAPQGITGKNWGAAARSSSRAVLGSMAGGEDEEVGRSLQLLVRQALARNLSRAYSVEGM